MRLRSGLVLCALVWSLAATQGFAVDGSERTLGRAARLFGHQLRVDHPVFRLNDDYVVWLLFDTHGDLFELDVGPKSYYTTEFPTAKKSKQEYLSEAEFEETLQRIARLKEIGNLIRRHASATPTDFGPLNTDRFERAFVDRIVAEGHADAVIRFNVYFVHEEAGSPEQLKTVQEQPMVCLVGLWYYLRPVTAVQIELGKWQTMRVAGPNLHGTTGCFRTTVLHDADGFTIEEPQNETIVVSEPYRVQVLAGHVGIGDQSLEGVNVEVRRIGGKKLLGTRTDAEGAFSISGAPEGRYKFKITKDGFKALRGTIFVDKHASANRLSFQLPVGT